MGRPAHYEDRFANAKAEYFWALRERLERGELAGLTDSQTIAQLGTIRWKATPQGKTAIESKEEMRSRWVKSPDRAEAQMLAFAENPLFVALCCQLEHQRERQKQELDVEARGKVLAPKPNPSIEIYKEMARRYQLLAKKHRRD